eukprot:6206093-Pleurochrysis_carterae.AAC.1
MEHENGEAVHAGASTAAAARKADAQRTSETKLYECLNGNGMHGSRAIKFMYSWNGHVDATQIQQQQLCKRLCAIAVSAICGFLAILSIFFGLLILPRPSLSLRRARIRGSMTDDHRATVHNSAADRTFLFVGGLQRSGTTWLEGLVTTPVTSALSFDNINPNLYEQERPWEHQNHTRSYFEMVARVGGVEGKFVQDVYSYVYLVRDVGANGKTIGNLIADERQLDRASSERLYRQWSIWWDTSKPILLEKTPENFLMGPFLQAAFGKHQTRFAFIMRHPFAWALAIEKWIFPEFVKLRTVEDRIGFWFDCMTRMVDTLPRLKDAIVLQLETLSTSADMQAAVARYLLCRTPGRAEGTRGAAALPAAIEATSGIMSSSVAYITCWLSGSEFRASLQRCVPRRPFHDPAFAAHPAELAYENAWRMRHILARHEAQANQLGYTFEQFELLSRLPPSELQRVRADNGSTDVPMGVVHDWRLVRSTLRKVLVVPTPTQAARTMPRNAAYNDVRSGDANTHSAEDAVKHSDARPSPAGQDASQRKHMLVVYHKLGLDKSKPTGMDIRMDQVLHSLLALRIRVHFVCHCSIEPSQLSPFGPDVRIYAGGMAEQLSQALATAPIEAALIFFTTLTMSVHTRMAQNRDTWHLEPREPLPEERVLRALVDRQTHVCTMAVADDIHHLRVVEVMSRYDALKARLASVWVKRRELAFLSQMDSILTVSLEDAHTMRDKLQESAARASEATAISSALSHPAALLRAASLSTSVQSSASASSSSSSLPLSSSTTSALSPSPLEQPTDSPPPLHTAACSSGCSCGVVWVPYTQKAVREASVAPFSTRREGMLYVGGMHGLAVIAVEWLLERVQPHIAAILSESGAAEGRGSGNRTGHGGHGGHGGRGGDGEGDGVG